MRPMKNGVGIGDSKRDTKARQTIAVRKAMLHPDLGQAAPADGALQTLF